MIKKLWPQNSISVYCSSRASSISHADCVMQCATQSLRSAKQLLRMYFSWTEAFAEKKLEKTHFKILNRYKFYYLRTNYIIWDKLLIISPGTCFSTSAFWSLSVQSGQSLTLNRAYTFQNYVWSSFTSIIEKFINLVENFWKNW